ncbi:hypothetical protein ACTFIY_010509 [Dictyostelium cf. discoideum]
MEHIRISQTGVEKANNKFIEEYLIGLALIILGSIVTITGVIVLGLSFCISSASYKKNIQSFLLVVNKNYKSRGIVWEFERQLVDNYYKYYIIISFPRTIQRFDNSEKEVEPTLTISDNSQYYPPSSQQTFNPNHFEPHSNSYSSKPSYNQFYPTPYSQNSYEPSSSSSPPAPLQLPYIYEKAQSVPLPQEILDMLELEERNAAKDI